jgi:hypothetical protein
MTAGCGGDLRNAGLYAAAATSAVFYAAGVGVHLDRYLEMSEKIDFSVCLDVLGAVVCWVWDRTMQCWCGLQRIEATPVTQLPYF